MKKVLVTGGSGNIGQALIGRLLNENPEVLVYNLDLQKSKIKDERLHNYYMDIRSNDLRKVFEEHHYDMVFHLIAMFKHIESATEGLSVNYQVEVLGTERILNLMVQHGIKQMTYLSSGSVYGYHKNLPELINESTQLYDEHILTYARNKVLTEKLIQRFVDEEKINAVIFRPCSILGSEIDNSITNWFKKRLILGIRGYESRFVFCWSQDVVSCMLQAMEKQTVGVYNIAGDGTITLKELAKKQRKVYLNLPEVFYRIAFNFLGLFGWSRYQVSQLEFLKYRPILSNEKLKDEFGFTPTKNSDEAFKLLKD